MSTDPIISVEGVSKKFCRSLKRTMIYGFSDVAFDMLGLGVTPDSLRKEEFWALNHVSFEVKRGECVGIVGANGAGKSTLLKLLNGITLPDVGTIKVVGRVGALLELGAGFHPMLTGRENIYLTAAILGLSEAEITRKIDAMIDFAGVEEFIDSPVKYYSSGMYVRLGFSVAAYAEPDILLIDEALAVGDALFQANCFAKIREFRERGTTIIFVTHSLELVTAHCSRALLINKGRLAADGDPKEVVDRYNRIIVSRNGKNGEPAKHGTTRLDEITDSRNTEWKGLFALNPKEDRYGSREAEILEVGIFDLDHVPVQVIEHNREFLVKIKVLHNYSMPAAVIAYSIKDPKGVVLCGTNTLYQKIDMGQVKSGTVVLVVFRQVARLNIGHYLLSVGCGAWEMGEYVVYDRRFDHIPFQVVGTLQRVGLFDPESEIEWKQLD